MRSTRVLAAFLVSFFGNTAWGSSPSENPGQFLDRFHMAASKAQFEEYFSYFHSSGVFIGTDASERWDIDAFRAYTKPIFAAGKGWTYQSIQRNVNFSPDGALAWFDEILKNESYGVCRGTGVLTRHGNTWQILQYHLTIPIPNSLAKTVVKMIREEKH